MTDSAAMSPERRRDVRTARYLDVAAAVCFVLGAISVAVGVFYFQRGVGMVLGIVIAVLLFVAAPLIQVARFAIRRRINQRDQQSPAVAAGETPSSD